MKKRLCLAKPAKPSVSCGVPPTKEPYRTCQPGVDPEFCLRERPKMGGLGLKLWAGG